MHDLLPQVTELFQRLRQADVLLGLDQYLLLVKALRMGYGQIDGRPDREALRRLCRLLWLEGPESASLFEYHFNTVMTSLPVTAVTETAAAVPAEQTTPPVEGQMAVTPEATASPSTSQVAADMAASATANQAVQLAERTSDPLTNLHAVLFASGPEQEVNYQRFLLASDYLPVTSRQMKQNWRYLRRMVREGAPVEMDVPATIRQVSRDGFLLNPVLRPRRVNKASLLLLLDQNGSMVPFHALGRRLQETALASGSLACARVYYFHNCPPLKRLSGQVAPHDHYREHNLFQKPQCVAARPLREIVADFKALCPSVLIFSDAGAARGGWNEERIQQTAAFIYQLLAHGVNHIAWLNPLPSSRWLEQENSATAIAGFVPMFSMNREGMYRAIQVLRGHSSLKVTLS
jgi:uncharacterized protein